MVLKLAASLAGLVKLRSSHTEIDNYVFRLHYRLTTSFCYFSCALVAASDIIGSAIQCIDGKGEKVPKAFNTYCWIKSTYTLNDTKAFHYGLGTENANHVRTVHAYYQWVPFVLFFQGCLFYLPHLLWKAVEGKTAEKLLQSLQFNSIDKEREKKKENIIKYLKSSWGHNNRYSVTYLACEVLNFLNVIAQMLLLDTFFGGMFMTYGSRVINFALEDSGARHDPMTMAFPRVTKCLFHIYGPTGSIQDLDAMCILPQNILNEKIFIAMWFWFVILATVSAMQVAWRITVVLSPMVRIKMMERRGRVTASATLEQAIRHLHIGDYFLLDILGRNLDALNFKDVLLGATGALKATNGSYTPYYEANDDDDPLAMKRHMEREETTAI